jgi:hypothetical protein
MSRTTCSWQLAGTDTFRRSSKKLFRTWGGNLQNTKRELLPIFIPDGDRVFVQADQAGAEAKIVAYLCPDGNFRELFKVGIKPHVFMALHIFESDWVKEGHGYVSDYVKLKPSQLPLQPHWKELNKVIKDNFIRYFIGKKSCHSFNYRMRPNTFQMDVLTESEGSLYLAKKDCEKIYALHQSLFPEIHYQWHKELDEVLRRGRTLYNLFGYPRYFGGPFTDEFFRKATSFIPQSTVGIITAIAFTRMQEYIEDNGLTEWDVLNDKHDSVLIQCPESDVQHAAEKLKSLLEVDLQSPRGEQFKMGAEVSIGRNWGKYDPDHNPEGMKEI